MGILGRAAADLWLVSLSTELPLQERSRAHTDLFEATPSREKGDKSKELFPINAAEVGRIAGRSCHRHKSSDCPAAPGLAVTSGAGGLLADEAAVGGNDEVLDDRKEARQRLVGHRRGHP